MPEKNKDVASPGDGTKSSAASGAGSKAHSGPTSGAASGTASSNVTSPPQHKAPEGTSGSHSGTASSNVTSPPERQAPGAGDSRSREDAKKSKREKAEQAVMPTMLSILKKKLGKRFKETREFVMFLVVVGFAVVYLIISSKLILDNMELPDEEKGLVRNFTTTAAPEIRATYPPNCIGSDGKIVCLPEAQYIDAHLSKSTLCTNPYGSICNENYFHSAEARNPSQWPYRYASLHYVYEAIWQAITVDFKNFTAPVDPANETAIYKTLYFIKNCTSEENRAKIHVGHIKRVLAKVGLPSSPYSFERNDTYVDVPVALGNVMKFLDLKLFFTVDFVADASQADAPFGKKVVLRKVPFNLPTGERRRSNEAAEVSEYVYTLMKTPHLLLREERLYNYITKSFYWFAKYVTNERHKWTEDEDKRTVTLAELRDATAIKNGTEVNKGFDWTLFFNTLLQNTSFEFKDSTKVNVEDYDSIVKVMQMVQNSSVVTVLNYITLAVWSLITPLLPKEYVHKLLYLPGSDYVALGEPHIRPQCFKLAEQFCPAGMAAVIRAEAALKKTELTTVRTEQFATAVYDASVALRLVSAEKEIGDIYRHYIGRFLQGLSNLIIPGNATSMEEKNNYFKQQRDHFAQKKIRVAIPEQFDKDVSELKCDVRIRSATKLATDDVVLYHFVDAVKQQMSISWNSRFTQASSEYDKSTASSFEFNVHYFDDHIFVPLVYAAGILQYPLFKETFVIMSLGDALKGLMRHLFNQRANDATRIHRGVPIIDIVWQNATALEMEYRAALNLTEALEVDHRWLWADMLATRWFFRIFGLDYGALKNEKVDLGLPRQYSHWMKYILFAEAACRQYQDISGVWWEVLYSYGIPPSTEINLSLKDYRPFLTSFYCDSDGQ